MKRKDWLIVILPLFATWALDRITKEWAEGLTGLNFYGPFGFVLHHNPGAMLGLFADLPAVLRVVSLSTGGAFLLFSFVVIQYLLPIKSLVLRVGMSILLGGILGNVTDRIIQTHVTDFILLGTNERHTPAFNVADALQWVGYFMIIYSLFREGEVLWPSNNSRNVTWVNFRFQFRYISVLLVVGLGFSIIAGIFSYTFLRISLLELIGPNEQAIQKYLVPFALTFTVVSLGFFIVLFLTGRVLSQRIAGPLYAFERFLEDLLVHGKMRKLRLRSGDEFLHLQELADRLVDAVQRRAPEAFQSPQPDQHPHQPQMTTATATTTTSDNNSDNDKKYKKGS